MTPHDSAGSAYGLTRPGPADVHAAVRRVYHDRGEEVWTTLLDTARLSGDDNAPDVVNRLIAAASTADDPVLTLIARAQRIRLTSFDRLSAIHGILASAGRPAP